MKFDTIDGCAVPRKATPVVRAIKRRRPDLRLNSCYRGSDPAAARILRRFGKATQAFLYRAYWILHLPGYRPANPPGFSTHELFNDGVAFHQWLRGAPIPAWAVGQDWSNGAAAAQAAREEGYVATLTYPRSPLESQHINVRKAPRRQFRALKRGRRGTRVRVLQRRLDFLGYGVNRSGHFGKATQDAVKRFQRDHHLKSDGVYGLHTHRQLLASVRWHKTHKERG